MNRISKSNLDEFKTQMAFSDDIPESTLYEMYAIYCILSRWFHNDTVQRPVLEVLNSGDGGDWGIDGSIITVNGKLITDIADIQEIIDTKMKMSVKIALLQAKTSPHFEAGGMARLYDGVRDLIADINDEPGRAYPASNERIDNLRNTLKLIYDNSSRFNNGQNPELDVYYICEGIFDGTPEQVAAIQKAEKDIKGSMLFSRVGLHQIGQRELLDIYTHLKTSRNVTLKIEKRITLPDVNGIEQSFLCVLPFNEFSKLIIGEDGQLQYDLFNENVRAYQGENNAVNKRIREAIVNEDKNSFALMNNGVTVIARSLRNTGDTFEIQDFQVVNGCQTCTELFKCRNEAGIENINIAVKLISSQHKEIRDKIIIANNSQTTVKEEQLISLLNIQKQIELYYNAQRDYTRLYYERRSRQYRYGDSDVPQDRVITIASQIKSFVSMILSEPHKVNGYYGSIVEDFKAKGRAVFDDKVKPEYYFLSAYTQHRLSRLISDKKINAAYKRFQPQLLLAFRLEAEPYPYKPLDPKSEKYCTHIFDILHDDTKCLKHFLKACALLDKAKTLCPESKIGNQSEDYTRAILKAKHAPAATTQVKMPRIIGTIDLSKIPGYRPIKRKK